MLQFTTVRQGQGGTLEARDGETLVGLITFVPAGPQTVDLNHTEVFPAFEGQGYGRQLVRAAVEFARSEGVKLKASCPYARKVLDHNPEFSDVIFR
jgi:predicted GNAT family acetyltransferase